VFGKGSSDPQFDSAVTISDRRPSLIRQGATKIVDFGISKVYLFADSGTIERQDKRCYDKDRRGALPVVFV